jgi:hypothetical protein
MLGETVVVVRVIHDGQVFRDCHEIVAWPPDNPAGGAR